MAKLKLNYAYASILIVFSLLIATQTNAKATERGKKDDVVCLRNQKLAKIHFFAHDVAGGPNSTVYEVARAAISGDALASFGKVNVIDDVITAGADPGSAELGRAQGTAASTDMKTTANAMSVNVVFTSGRYNGSTIALAGRNPVMERQRRLAVVGGTGVFRFTRGYAVTGTYSSRVGGDSVFYGVFEYSIYTTFC